MKIFLPNVASSHKPLETKHRISERLPPQVTGCCDVHTSLSVSGKKEDFYVLELCLKGALTIECMRCIHDFDWEFDEKITLAVTDSDEKAEKLMTDYECIVSTNLHIELTEIVIDSLNLMIPEIHPDVSSCNLSEVEAYLLVNNE